MIVIAAGILIAAAIIGLVGFGFALVAEEQYEGSGWLMIIGGAVAGIAIVYFAAQ